MAVIAVANLKGGVGKSTISQNMAVLLAKSGKSVCLIDTDSVQESTAEWGAIREKKGFLLIPVHRIEEDRLMSQILDLAEKHDIVLVDGTPVLGEITTKMMSVSDIVLIPVMPSGNDFRALRKFLFRCEDVKNVKQRQGFSLEIAVVLNEYNDKLIIDKAILDAIRKLDVRILNTTIGNRAAYREATLTGSGVSEMKDKKAIQEMEELTSEVMQLVS